jgi:hypothetical protein
MATHFLTTMASTPLYHGCIDASAQALPYCNESLPHAARVEDVISRLNISEKIGLLSPHDPPNYCGCLTAAVPRIGLPEWKWLTEANTDVGIQCVEPGACPTVFVRHRGAEGACGASPSHSPSSILTSHPCVCMCQVGPLGVAASFNRSLWWAKGDVLSTELRALNNLGISGTALSGLYPRCRSNPGRARRC